MATQLLESIFPDRKGITWLRLFAKPDFLPFESKPYQVVVTFDDITALKQIEFMLRTSEAKFHSVIEHASDAIVLVNGDGQVIEWNKTMEDLTGVSRQTAIQKNIWDVRYSLYPPKLRNRPSL